MWPTRATNGSEKSPPQDIVSTLTGDGTPSYLDGAGATAQFLLPRGSA